MKATSETLADLLNLAETSAEVRDWRIAGVRVWPMLRVRWFFAILSDQYFEKSLVTGRVTSLVRYLVSVVGAWCRWIRVRWADRRAEADVSRQSDVVFVSDGVSFVNIDGRHYDRFCDPLIELLIERGVSSVMLTAGNRFLAPRHRASKFLQPAIDFAHLRGAVSGSKLISTAVLPGNQQVRDALGGSGVDHASLMPSRVAADVGRVLAVSRVFGALFDRIRPRLVFVVSYYNLDGMALALACRKRGICLVDIQHGVQGVLHPAYGRMPPAPPEGFDLVPHRFWVWSEEEFQAIAQWGGSDRQHAAVVGGNVWLDHWLRGEGRLARDADARVRELCARTSRVPRVLVTLQWGLSDAEQNDPLAALIRAAGERCVFWIRIHPVMLPERAAIERHYAQFSNAWVFVAEATDLPLYALLRHADVHLTHSSSTVIEAQLFGVRSVVMSRYGAEIYPRQISDGTARLVEGGTAELFDALLEQAGARGTVSAPADRAGPALDTLLAEAGITSSRAP
jgi:hypothetical protein